jgi:superfamily I DNA and/or RNA helicase
MAVAGLIVNILAVVAAAVAAFFALRANEKADAAQRISEGALLNQILVQMLFEYRSAEMLSALRSLKRFRENHKNDLSQAYEESRKSDTDRIDNLVPTDRLEYERTTLHHQRRLVSQFYGILAGIHEQRIIPANILYSYWAESDLRIIPDILLPIEDSLAQALGGPKTHPATDRMLRLYEDSKHFYPEP